MRLVLSSSEFRREPIFQASFHSVVLTPERLNAVYGMDVPAWMRSLYAQWAEDNEKAPLPGELARRSRD